LLYSQGQIWDKLCYWTHSW